jgi:hypothetical protein
MSQSMYVGMGLKKNSHSVWIVRHKVPKHVEGPVARVLDNGKERQAYLQKTTGTKDKTEAKRIAVDLLAGFQDTLRQAEALLTERPLRPSLAQSETDRIALCKRWPSAVWTVRSTLSTRPLVSRGA